MWSSLPCFLTFVVLLSLHLVTFFITCLCHTTWLSFTRLSPCKRQTLGWEGLGTRLGIWTIDSGISQIHWQYWLKNHWPKHLFKHKVNPSLDRWQSRLSSEDRSRHSNSMDNFTHSFIHSFINSDIFIFVIETYLSLFNCLIQLTTQRIHPFFDPMFRYMAQIPVSVFLIWVIISYHC